MAKLVKKLSLKQGDTSEEFYFDATTGVKGYEMFADEDVVIGRWTDGKPIYRRVVHLASTGAHQSYPYTFPDTSDKVDTMIRVYGVVYQTTKTANNNQNSIPWSSGTNGACFYYTEASGVPKIQFYSTHQGLTNKPAELIMEFTKQSDQPDSFVEEKVELTAEHKTGETFNGKDVYEKIIFGIMPNTKVKAKIADTASLNIESMIYYDGFVTYADGGVQRIQDICDDSASQQWSSRLVYTVNQGIYAITAYPYWGGLQTVTHIKYTKKA